MFNHTHWRLIRSDPNRGAWHMAIDESILEFSGNHQVPPTLRFYTWDPPCLSLGYSQSKADIDEGNLARLGWDLVRRPTGGKAILHTDELTYSVIAPADNRFVQGSVLDAYRRIALALVSGLRLLGLNPSSDALYPDTECAKDSSPVCFEKPSNYEIAVDGKKLLGSAQSRRLGGVLQHGSLPLFGDITRIVDGLIFSSKEEMSVAKERVRQRATTLECAHGVRLPNEVVMNALIAGFVKEWSLEFSDGCLTMDEEQRALELVRHKYANTEWTSRL